MSSPHVKVYPIQISTKSSSTISKASTITTLIGINACNNIQYGKAKLNTENDHSRRRTSPQYYSLAYSLHNTPFLHFIFTRTISSSSIIARESNHCHLSSNDNNNSTTTTSISSTSTSIANVKDTKKQSKGKTMDQVFRMRSILNNKEEMTKDDPDSSTIVTSSTEHPTSTSNSTSDSTSTSSSTNTITNTHNTGKTTTTTESNKSNGWEQLWKLGITPWDLGRPTPPLHNELFHSYGSKHQWKWQRQNNPSNLSIPSNPSNHSIPSIPSNHSNPSIPTSTHTESPTYTSTQCSQHKRQHKNETNNSINKIQKKETFFSMRSLIPGCGAGYD